MTIIEILQYVLFGTICYSGLFVGYMLAKISPEELKSGEKWFKLLQKIILLLIILSFVLLPLMVFKIIAILVLLYVVIKINEITLENNNTYLTYPVIGILIGLTPLSYTILPVTFLCFGYGVPTGTLIQHENKYKKMKFFKLVLIFFISLAVGLGIQYFFY